MVHRKQLLGKVYALLWEDSKFSPCFIEWINSEKTAEGRVDVARESKHLQEK